MAKKSPATYCHFGICIDSFPLELLFAAIVSPIIIITIIGKFHALIFQLKKCFAWKAVVRKWMRWYDIICSTFLNGLQFVRPLPAFTRSKQQTYLGINWKVHEFQRLHYMQPIKKKSDYQSPNGRIDENYFVCISGQLKHSFGQRIFYWLNWEFSNKQTIKPMCSCKWTESYWWFAPQTIYSW